MPVVAGPAVRPTIRSTVGSAVVTRAGAVVAPAAVIAAPVVRTVAVQNAVRVAFTPVHVESPDRIPEFTGAPVVGGRGGQCRSGAALAVAANPSPLAAMAADAAIP